MTNKTEEDLAKFSLIKNNFYKKYNGAIKKLRLISNLFPANNILNEFFF